MKLVYTDIRNPLTQYLTDTAAEFAKEAKRVFTLLQTLSFEMERKVLEYLPEQATFDIIVTRFGQLARYLMIDRKEAGQPLDDVGLAMIFFRVLSQFKDGDLKVYGRLQTDFGFINQLVALYKELQRANMSILDLEAMESPDKQADLVKIFLAVTDILSKEGFEHQSQLAQLTSLVETGQLDEQLKNIVLVVDGFSRFSAEEEALVSALNERVSEI